MKFETVETHTSTRMVCSLALFALLKVNYESNRIEFQINMTYIRIVLRALRQTIWLGKKWLSPLIEIICFHCGLSKFFSLVITNEPSEKKHTEREREDTFVKNKIFFYQIRKERFVFFVRFLFKHSLYICIIICLSSSQLYHIV